MGENVAANVAFQEAVWLDANRFYDAESRYLEVLLVDLLKIANPSTPPKVEPSVGNSESTNVVKFSTLNPNAKEFIPNAKSFTPFIMGDMEKPILEATKIVEEQVDAAIQQKRAAALQKEMKQKEEWIANGRGEYSTLSSEEEFYGAVDENTNVILHLCRAVSRHCAIVDKHFHLLAKKHIETKFCKIDVENAFFLCYELKIRSLPTILLCKEHRYVDFMVGFGSLGGVDDFTTEMMEWRLAKSGVINYEGDLSVVPDFGYRRRQRRGWDWTGRKAEYGPVYKHVQKNIRGGSDGSDSD